MGPSYVEISLSIYICIKTWTVNLRAMERGSAQINLCTKHNRFMSMCDSILSHPSEAVTARHELWFGRLCRARAAHTWACSIIINTLCSLIDHTSHPYSNLGTATAQYSLLPLIGLISPVLLPILKIIFTSFLWQVILSLQKSLSAFFVLHSGIPTWRWLSTCFNNCYFYRKQVFEFCPN